MPQPEPTDADLQDKLRRARTQAAPTLRNTELETLGTLLPGFKPLANCRRCQVPLPSDRVWQCESCDGGVELEVLQRHLREQDAAVELAFSRSGLPPAYCPRHRMQEGRISITQPARTWAAVVKECAPDVPATFGLLGTRSVTGLYLWGAAGSFKTSAAAAYLAKEIASGAHGRYAYVPSIFSELFAIYASPSSGMSRADIVERYGFAEMLVLDDLGKEKPTEHGAAVINEILDLRYRMRCGWTIITSNYQIEEFEARINAAVGEEYGQPISRRIVELCEMVPMEKRP